MPEPTQQTRSREVIPPSTPHTTSLRSGLGTPVYDIYSMVSWFHAGLRPRTWDWKAGE